MIDEFEPDAERAQMLDARMRSRLADSISYIFGEVGNELQVDDGVVAELVAQIRSHPQSPQRFGLYYDLVLAIDREDLAQARRLAASLVAPREPVTFRITRIQDASKDEAERYARLLLSDPGLAHPVTTAQFTAACARVNGSLGLLDAGFPAMADEIRTLLHEVVLAAGSEEPGARSFSAGSSYMLWGAMLWNAVEPLSRLDLAQSLAHESGHNLLFGLCTDGPLVENPDDEFYASPLRADPRPMDGVVHAVYIIARMHMTVQRLLASGVLEPRERAAAEEDLAIHGRNFEKGDRTVREHARLTPVGVRIMEAARAHMAAHSLALQD
jgi:HEXXH motif-containing protein